MQIVQFDSMRKETQRTNGRTFACRPQLWIRKVEKPDKETWVNYEQCEYICTCSIVSYSSERSRGGMCGCLANFSRIVFSPRRRSLLFIYTSKFYLEKSFSSCKCNWSSWESLKIGTFLNKLSAKRRQLQRIGRHFYLSGWKKPVDWQLNFESPISNGQWLCKQSVDRTTAIPSGVSMPRE